MPSIRYYNQSAPFWDFVANLEEQGSNHPFFRRREGEQGEEGEFTGRWGPWGIHRGFPFRGPPPPPHPHHPPPPHHGSEEHPPPPPPEGENVPPPPPEGGEPSHPPPTPGQGREHHRGPRGGCPGRRGRGFGGRGGHHGRGPWGMGGGMPWGFAPFLSPFFNAENNDESGEGGADPDFTPEADVFDTETKFVVHVSLPGAKKEDVGVNWDAEKSELSIAGVVYRPGDEDFLKTLAMDERKVGPFERKIRLGSRANPAQVDADMITAKLEDGVLRIEVPKLDKDYVEVKKVDIL